MYIEQEQNNFEYLYEKVLKGSGGGYGQNILYTCLELSTNKYLWK